MIDIHESARIAKDIAEQATSGALMSLGAYPLHPTILEANDDRRGGALWDVRVLPMKANGKRASRPRIMQLRVHLTYADTYTVSVRYYHAGKEKIHFCRGDVYADQLARLILALDWDGDEVLNPRVL